jgi:hypothetical protein
MTPPDGVTLSIDLLSFLFRLAEGRCTHRPRNNAGRDRHGGSPGEEQLYPHYRQADIEETLLDEKGVHILPAAKEAPPNMPNSDSSASVFPRRWAAWACH